MGRSLPPLNALRAFELTSRMNSFTEAAADLCITPGAVSRHIANLEGHLGTALFERQHRQVQLTPLGASYAEELHGAFDRIEEATASLRDAGRRQRIRLGLFPTIATGWLILRLSVFQALHPAIELQVTCKTDFIEGDRHRFDVFSVRGPVTEPGIEYQPIVQLILRPVCSPNLLGRLREPGDLRRCTTLHSIHRRGDWEAWLEHAGVGKLDPGKMLLFENSALAYHAAVNGVGVAMGICCVSRDDIASGRLVEPFAQKLPTGQSYGLAWQKLLTRVPAIRAFRDWVRAEMATQPEATAA